MTKSSHTSMRTAEVPDICGKEERVAEATSGRGRPQRAAGSADFEATDSAFAIALHMHQPLIPAGGRRLRTAAIISNLQYMLDHPDEGDNHNAPVFRSCYKRMGEFVPQLLDEGVQPRVMLDYSGCLLWGLQQSGMTDVFDLLRPLATDPACAACVEWLGCAWGHPVAPSTPMQDYRLHVRAWQHQFASLFGFEALRRVRGFSPSEMALPNHPDVCYEFVSILRECGYEWVIVQEHTVEQPGDGGPVHRPHLPHRLIAKNSRGEIAEIIAIVKTQGSDAKLIGQMQPYFEAKELSRTTLADRSISPLVTQISDGENGGVMMNEFPPKYKEVVRECSDSKTPIVNVSEYLGYLEDLGITAADFPPLQPIMQQKIWDRFEDGAGPEPMKRLIEELEQSNAGFHMDGGSWTSDISWVRGYENVLGPMERLSALFAEKVLNPGVPTTDPRYRNALYYLLMTQTSCYRYWGKGRWTDYARELCRRGTKILEHDF
jgi:hypothetical protein